uniref:Uncharacterized protein n=1 Tax=Panagrellus redivivus TaxID=6233 RepID=A0A7E4VIA1_PANRE
MVKKVYANVGIACALPTFHIFHCCFHRQFHPKMSLPSSLLERLKKRGIISQPEPQVEVFVEDKSTEETADDDLKTRGGAP